MREIKFRAWNPETKTMVYELEEINLLGTNIVAGISSGQIKASYMKGRGLWIEAELMQYTGLEDKHGKGIYEGDIVNVVALPVSPLKENMIVRYDNETGSFMLKGSVFDFSLRQAKVGTVLGNIYENPELLEEQHD